MKLPFHILPDTGGRFKTQVMLGRSLSGAPVTITTMNIFKIIGWFADTVSTFETEVERRERLGTHLYGNDWRAPTPTHETHHHYHGSGRLGNQDERKRQRIL